MANFWVTGVWKDGAGVITDIFAHEILDSGGYLRGVKKTLAEAVKMIEDNHVLTTRRWDYTNSRWATGARILIVTERGGKYIRTKPDAQTQDNLDNMLPMSLAIA